MMIASKLSRGVAGLVLACAPVIGSSAQSGRPAPPYTVGEPFPSIVLPDLEDGRPRSIADFRGRKLILHIFASW